jgi:uncharacterized protein
MTREWEAAVRRGSIDELQRLFDNGSDIDARDGHGQTALMVAASRGSSALVDWLVERGANLDHTAKYGLSALMLAIVRGHVDVVSRLATAGANLDLRGTGAPGFAGKTALDLATARNDPAMIGILRSSSPESTITPSNPHFETASNWKAAREMLTFRPIQPRYTAGRALQFIRIHVRDHKGRELPIADRTLEAYYEVFTVSQARRGEVEARRLALSVPYGQHGQNTEIAGCSGRVYELGPEPEPTDIDGRMPAVVVWHDGEIFHLIASGEMESAELVRIARSLYAYASSKVRPS